MLHRFGVPGLLFCSENFAKLEYAAAFGATICKRTVLYREFHGAIGASDRPFFGRKGLCQVFFGQIHRFGINGIMRGLSGTLICVRFHHRFLGKGGYVSGRHRRDGSRRRLRLFRGSGYLYGSREAFASVGALAAIPASSATGCFAFFIHFSAKALSTAALSAAALFSFFAIAASARRDFLSAARFALRSFKSGFFAVSGAAGAVFSSATGSSALFSATVSGSAGSSAAGSCTY